MISYWQPASPGYYGPPANFNGTVFAVLALAGAKTQAGGARVPQALLELLGHRDPREPAHRRRLGLHRRPPATRRTLAATSDIDMTGATMAAMCVAGVANTDSAIVAAKTFLKGKLVAASGAFNSSFGANTDSNGVGRLRSERLRHPEPGRRLHHHVPQDADRLPDRPAGQPGGGFKYQPSSTGATAYSSIDAERAIAGGGFTATPADPGHRRRPDVGCGQRLHLGYRLDARRRDRQRHHGHAVLGLDHADRHDDDARRRARRGDDGGDPGGLRHQRHAVDRHRHDHRDQRHQQHGYEHLEGLDRRQHPGRPRAGARPCTSATRSTCTTAADCRRGSGLRSRAPVPDNLAMEFLEATDPVPTRSGVFLGYLDYFRAAVVSKVEALPESEMRTSRLPSGWTPLELLQHLTFVEMRWLEWGFEGRTVADPWGDQRDGRWCVEPDVTRAQLVAASAAQAVRTRAVIESHDLADARAARRPVGRRRAGVTRARAVPSGAGVRPPSRAPRHRRGVGGRPGRRVAAWPAYQA